MWVGKWNRRILLGNFYSKSVDISPQSRSDCCGFCCQEMEEWRGMSRILLVLKYWRIFNFWNLIRDFINSNGYSCPSIVVYEEIINFNGFFYYFSRVYHFIGIRRCCSPNSVIYYLGTAKCQSFRKLLCRTVLSPFLLWTLWLLDIFLPFNMIRTLNLQWKIPPFGY